MVEDGIVIQRVMPGGGIFWTVVNSVAEIEHYLPADECPKENAAARAALLIWEADHVERQPLP